MNSKLLVVLINTGVLASGVMAYAHHSFGATYNVDKRITHRGKSHTNLVPLAAFVLFRRGSG